MTNDVCDPLCNITQFAYDNGRCELNPTPGCDSKKGDLTCDPECNYYLYDYDGGDCCLPENYYNCSDPSSNLKRNISTENNN